MFLWTCLYFFCNFDTYYVLYFWSKMKRSAGWIKYNKGIRSIIGVPRFFFHQGQIQFLGEADLCYYVVFRGRNFSLICFIRGYAPAGFRPHSSTRSGVWIQSFFMQLGAFTFVTILLICILGTVYLDEYVLILYSECIHVNSWYLWLCPGYCIL